jgi:hypothetical protein
MPRFTIRVELQGAMPEDYICCCRIHPFPFGVPSTDHFGRKDFLPVEPQGGLSFLFRLSEPRLA